jgi:two-component system cell cycle sensor histidine kinase/response regulator CckA
MKNRSSVVQVLLIEDNIIDARFVSADFQMRGESQFFLHNAQRVDEAAKILQTQHIDVILLDLFLKETQGLDTISAVRGIAPDTPVVVLTGLNDEELALQALKHGAQDYLIKGTVDNHLMFRAIRYAIERKQGELDKRSLEERSVQMQKLEALGTLAGGVAHNFNNMMMAVLGHSYFLLEATQDENARRHIEAIKTTANRASALTRQLMMFSHRGSGDLVPVDLNSIIRDTEELIRSVLGPDIELKLELTPHAVRIHANTNQIQQMLMSLVLNARHSISASGHLVIRTEGPMTGSQADARLTITDDGCGMSAETRAHIFEPFFTTKGLAVAAGLGLSTVYGIVEQHKGRIEVKSEVGEGTSFAITFPSFAATSTA